MTYIDKAALYNKIAQLEEAAREMYLDTPNNSHVCEQNAQKLSELTKFKHMVLDFPAEDVAQVTHGNLIYMEFLGEPVWVCSNCGRVIRLNCYDFEPQEIGINYCQECGAKLDLGVINDEKAVDCC